MGFRPHVHQCAARQNIAGYVSNEPDGVHVLFNAATIKEAHAFTEVIIQQAPSIAIIRKSSLTEVKSQSFSEFTIAHQQSNALSDLLIAPDFALCPNCRSAFHDPSNRRYHQHQKHQPQTTPTPHNSARAWPRPPPPSRRARW